MSSNFFITGRKTDGEEQTPIFRLTRYAHHGMQKSRCSELKQRDLCCKSSISYIEGLVTAKNGVHEFDAYGNPIQETTFDKQGRINSSYHYENSYDEMGNLTQTKRQAAGSDIVVEYNYIYGYIYTPNAA